MVGQLSLLEGAGPSNRIALEKQEKAKKVQKPLSVLLGKTTSFLFSFFFVFFLKKILHSADSF